MIIKKFSQSIKEKILLESKVLNLSKEVIFCINKIYKTLKDGGKVFLCGNGGSAADAQHLSAEFTSRFLFDRPGLASIALGTNCSAMTAIGNDYGYENVFAREIEAIANPTDLIIAITTSGNSVNIIKAIEAAQRKNVTAVVLTGKGMGKLKEKTNTLNVPSTDTARIQECHILLGHIICGIVEAAIFKANGQKNEEK